MASLSSPTNTTNSPDPTFPSLENCQSMTHLKQIHSQFIINGAINNPVVQTRLIAFCCTHNAGDMDYARGLFAAVPDPNVYVWNTMIRGHSRRNSPINAASLYVEMLEKGVKPDDYTFPFLLKSIAPGIGFNLGREFHGQILKLGFDSNVFVQNALIHMYALFGEMGVARQVFDKCSKRDVVSWNAMISGYNKVKRFEEAVRVFVEMERERIGPTAVTLVSVLSACAKLKDLEMGKRVHLRVADYDIELNLILENALVDMYAACGEMGVAVEMFRNMNVRDVITWTAMVTGFANAGQVDQAREYFDEMPERDKVSWTAMTDGYLRASRFKEALDVFREMQGSNIRPDGYTMVSILRACAHLGALEVGEWIRCYIDKNKIRRDVVLGNALIDMYSKCGNVESARKIFEQMVQKDKFSWTAMIVGLAVNGHGEEALDLFTDMLEASIAPDDVTFIGVLSACTHGGMVEKGRRIFSKMTIRHGIEPNMAHYGCMVDLLGRAGHLKEAQEVIQNMPMKPNSIVWGALLGGCRIHKNAEVAEIAVKKMLELEPENGSVYVLLSNVYAACNRWKDVHKIRDLMMVKGIKKIPGCSLIEMNGAIHEFVAGDVSHSQSAQIYSKLEEMAQDLKVAGYRPDTSEVLLDIGEEEKETAIYQHSEKLAIAFGLISSGPKATIRIVKNLRMCNDCHRMAKSVSRVYNREVIVRDRTRFHHFRHGSCSCKDYW
ncbi:hypothetical protein Syun_011008 [Stephania yunnanensis]|uniref:DYW domain-containing protein n=1 Tax=Stephania yunnanensis TaxID=152371 RepID=A0AAP0PE22_9MAGN